MNQEPPSNIEVAVRVHSKDQVSNFDGAWLTTPRLSSRSWDCFARFQTLDWRIRASAAADRGLKAHGTLTGNLRQSHMSSYWCIYEAEHETYETNPVVISRSLPRGLPSWSSAGTTSKTCKIEATAISRDV